MNLDLISYSATAPGAAGAGAALAGDSLTIKNSKTAPMIVAAWGTNQTAGFHQLAYPSGHDTTRGYRCGAPAAGPNLILPWGAYLEPRPQELLSITVAGSAVAGDVEQGSLLLYYPDLPGVEARLITPGNLWSRYLKETTIEASIVSVAGPSYAGEELISADSDLLKANTDYAVLGLSSRTACHNLCLRGPDLGNLRVAVPGILRPELTQRFFVALSAAHNRAMIPVINSGNKSSTFIGVSTDENAGTFVVTLHLIELR